MAVLEGDSHMSLMADSLLKTVPRCLSERTGLAANVRYVANRIAPLVPVQVVPYGPSDVKIIRPIEPAPGIDEDADVVRPEQVAGGALGCSQLLPAAAFAPTVTY